MKPITIRIAGPDEQFPGSFIVEQGGHYADGLGWDEMLGQIVALTMRVPEVRDRISRFGPGLYSMETPEERAEREALREARIRDRLSDRPVVVAVDLGKPGACHD